MSKGSTIYIFLGNGIWTIYKVGSLNFKSKSSSICRYILVLSLVCVYSIRVQGCFKKIIKKLRYRIQPVSMELLSATFVQYLLSWVATLRIHVMEFHVITLAIVTFEVTLSSHEITFSCVFYQETFQIRTRVEFESYMFVRKVHLLSVW